MLSVVSDYKVGVDDNSNWEAEYYESEVKSAQDYYAFGQEMPGRNYNSPDYRYGFNGKEKDEDGELGELTHYDYGFRIYNPGIGKFLSVDPLALSYPFYTPYQYAGNKPIRFIDLDGLEEADPSSFRTGLNYAIGDWHKNRMNRYLTENGLTSDNVITLPNETFVVIRTVENANNAVSTTYSVFRQSKKKRKLQLIVAGWQSSLDDDLDLSEEEFLNTEVMGNQVFDAPDPISKSAKVGSLVLAGSNDLSYVFRETVGVVQEGAKQLNNWKSKIKFGVLDAVGSSKDLLKKGFHVHFKELDNLELSLKPMADGKIGLGFISGNQKMVTDAVKLFNQAMENSDFRASLLVRLKAGQETLQGAGKVLGNSKEAKMAIDKAHEFNFLIDSVKNY